MLVKALSGNYEYAVVLFDSVEARALQGTGQGDTFVPNPLNWHQTAVNGPFQIFARLLGVSNTGIHA